MNESASYYCGTYCFVYVLSVWFGLCSSSAVSAVSLYLVESVVPTKSKSILCSCFSCSAIIYPFLWYSCMYSDSHQFINLPFPHAFTNSIIRSFSPYSCLLSRTCSAYADWVLFERIYLISSLHMASVDLPICTMYTPWHVLEVRLLIPLGGMAFSLECVNISNVVLIDLYAPCSWEFRNKLVIPLMYPQL